MREPSRRTNGTVLRIAGFVLALAVLPAEAAQIDIPGPLGSGAFGKSVAVLANGNIVVTDPDGPASNVGAVYLYSPAGIQISMLTGSTANDHVGNGGIVVLSNGNFVIVSWQWNSGAGAVTWVNGSTGITGSVSAVNSLVGTSAGDYVGANPGVTELGNGNYVVASSYWASGGMSRAGAVTWCNGGGGTTGPVSPGNSLVGNHADDRVGYLGVVALSNGNYVVRSPYWKDGIGAATWGNGSTGISGAVSLANSLTGSATNDNVGGIDDSGIVALGNGNYVVASPYWDNGSAVDAGAATWGNGATGISGMVSPSNSLVGTTASDHVGNVVALSNGNYVVASPNWDNGGTADVGAATWGNGSTGISGAVSAANSLVGTTAGDGVGASVAALSNGNYVVGSWYWSNGATSAVGAATWVNGSTGISGTVSAVNSLVGTTADDRIGTGIAALSNGNYVVKSSFWHSGGVAEAGAATWGNGSTGTTGVVSGANSLVGTSAGDHVGATVIALSNGNYVVASRNWDNGGAVDAGAVTWGNGYTGTSGAVSPDNSLVGTTASDHVGDDVVALSNGNYVARSPVWDHGGTADVGAATWGNGFRATSASVSPANSLIGTTAGDRVTDGSFFGAGITAVGNSNYVVRSALWQNGGILNAGAISLGRGSSGTFGLIASTNSVRGTVFSGGGTGAEMLFAYDATRDTLVVGQPEANIVSLFKADLLFTNGFE